MAVQYHNQISLENAFKNHENAAGRFIMDFLPQLAQEMASVTISNDESKPDIVYDIIRIEDSEPVLDLLKRTFFKDEPLNKYVGLTDDGDCKDLEEYCLKSLDQLCSFKATDNRTGKIVGVILNGIITKPSPNDPAPETLQSKAKHRKFKLIMGLMDLIDSKFDMFEKYPEIDAFVDGKILAVDPDCRGMGIAGQLTNETIEYMKAHNLEIFQMLCSSHFSARVCEKLGFSEVFNLPFTDYVDEQNCQILNPEKPHVAARIFTQRITN